jgi:two-component system LytT family sensor kinase
MTRGVDLRRFRQIAWAYLLSIGAWGSLSLLTGWQYRIFDQALNIHSSLLDMLRLAEARGFTFAVLTPPIFYLVRKNIERVHLVRYLIACCAGVGPFMVLYAWIHWIVLPPWDVGLQGYVSRSRHSPFELIQGGFADLVTIYIALLVAAHAYEYFVGGRKQELERYEHQQALAASEMQALNMQLHPHFLFNTLQGISTLMDSDHKTAKAMVINLSGLLRTVLQYGSSDLISLQEELQFVGKYLELEKMRLGPRLAVTWSLDSDTEQVLVPQMILQPLVENAVRHGIACTREGGWIEIRSKRSNGKIELEVRNSVGGKGSAGTGVGLTNTEARLKYLYSDEASLSFVMADDRTATATIVLPALGAQQHCSRELNRLERIKTGTQTARALTSAAVGARDFQRGP